MSLNFLQEKEGMTLVCTGTKLGAKFSITGKEQQHGLTYSVVCPGVNCNEEYNGERSRRLTERIHKHSAKDVNSHLFKHSAETDHPTVTIDNCRVLKTGYCQKNVEKKVTNKINSR